jgi:hypothetical protein
MTRELGSFPSRGKRVSVLHNVQTGYWSQLTCYPVDIGGCFNVGNGGRIMTLTSQLHLVPRCVEKYVNPLYILTP